MADGEYIPPAWVECYECRWKFRRPENPVPWKFCPMCGTEWIGPVVTEEE